MSEVKVIFWDFDGVIMDSMQVRDKGFKIVLKDFPDAEVSQLMAFHRRNGGLSRYVKFRYFFEEVKNTKITDGEVEKWAGLFSEVMLNNLMDPNLLIDETLNFIRNEGDHYIMHIVSGSDQKELRQICDELNISTYFNSIHGSPKPKTQWVKEIIEEEKYSLKECVLIGDSRNDFDAAESNGIGFMGYNNKEVEKLTTRLVEL